MNDYVLIEAISNLPVTTPNRQELLEAGRRYAQLERRRGRQQGIMLGLGLAVGSIVLLSAGKTYRRRRW